MSQGELLYVKSMDLSESESDDDIWDDRKLNVAYDTAVEIAKAEVAKRVAQATNTQPGETSKSEELDHKGKCGPSKVSKKSPKSWSAGMHCRAVYKGDGSEYEALITRVVSNKDCLVTFLGYGNTDVVPLHTLKQSYGKDERANQIHQALLENIDEEEESYVSGPPPPTNHVSGPQNPESYESPDSSHGRAKYKSRRNPKQDKIHVPNMPFPPVLPNISPMKNMGCAGAFPDIPIAPPLPFPQEDAEDQAVSSMLVSWYMSGYYAGLYQGIKRAKRNHKRH